MSRSLASALVIGLLFASRAHAVDPPRHIAVQGRLMTSGGQPATGAPTSTLRLFDQLSSGTLLHAEDEVLTLDGNGVFSVTLGDDGGNLIAPEAFGCPLFLEITLEGGETLAPRLPLVAAPQATFALEAAGLTGDGGTVTLAPVSGFQVTADRFDITATGGGAGDGGSVSVSSAGDFLVDVVSIGLSVDATGVGDGGSISLSSGGGFQLDAYSLELGDAGGGGIGGGFIKIDPAGILELEGSEVRISANGGGGGAGSGGTMQVTAGRNLFVEMDGIDVQASGTGDGGSINLSANTTMDLHANFLTAGTTATAVQIGGGGTLGVQVQGAGGRLLIDDLGVYITDGPLNITHGVNLGMGGSTGLAVATTQTLVLQDMVLYNGARIQNLQAPATANEPATKDYVDNACPFLVGDTIMVEQSAGTTADCPQRCPSAWWTYQALTPPFAKCSLTGP